MAENERVDLSSLRISRDADPASTGGSSRLGVRIGAAIVLVAIVVVGTYFIGGMLDAAVEIQLTTVTMSSPSQADAVLTASGYVVAQRKASVASKATGRLVYLGVVEGDRVKKNEIIARLEDSDILAQLNQAKANLRVNEADLKDAVQWLARQKSLLDKGLSTQAEYDGAEARHQRVLASIEYAEALVAAAEVALENTRIRAPFDGTVLTKNADIGEMVVPMAASVGSKAAVVTIADMASLQVEADVSESNIERISHDQPCEITLDAYPETRYQGFVSKIVPTADRAKATVMVKIGFNSYDRKVLPEMSAKVLFLTKPQDASEANAKPILTVSSAAVVTRGGQKVVYRVEQNEAIEVPVTVGRDLGALVEVTHGLSAGDKVINKVDDRMQDGTKVKVQ